MQTNKASIMSRACRLTRWSEDDLQRRFTLSEVPTMPKKHALKRMSLWVQILVRAFSWHWVANAPRAVMSCHLVLLFFYQARITFDVSSMPWPGAIMPSLSHHLVKAVSSRAT